MDDVSRNRRRPMIGDMFKTNGERCILLSIEQQWDEEKLLTTKFVIFNCDLHIIQQYTFPCECLIQALNNKLDV